MGDVGESTEAQDVALHEVRQGSGGSSMRKIDTSISAGDSVTVELPKNPLNFLPRRLVKDVPLSSLREYPGNPKDHDVGAILESMQQNGIVDMIYVQEWPKTPKYILAGHGRKQTLISAGIKVADCIFVKISPAAAKRYVIASNRAAERGGWNDALLVDYLKGQSQADQLLGTGFDADDVDDLINTLTPPSLEELERKHGIATDEATWPVYRCRLPHNVYDHLVTMIKEQDEPTEWEAIERILLMAEEPKDETPRALNRRASSKRKSSKRR